MMDLCIQCRGELVLERVRHESHWGGELAVVEDVPAWVCQQCGERYYDAEVSAALGALAKSPPPPVRTITVPVYTYAQAKPEKRRQAS